MKAIHDYSQNLISGLADSALLNYNALNQNWAARLFELLCQYFENKVEVCEIANCITECENLLATDFCEIIHFYKISNCTISCDVKFTSYRQLLDTYP